MSFYQSALGDRLEYELTINDYSRVITVTVDAYASSDVANICFEYDMVTQPELAPEWSTTSIGADLQSYTTGS